MALRHPSRPAAPIRLYGRRVMMRPLAPADFRAWSEIRRTNDEWLSTWEPRRHQHQPDPTIDRSAFSSRCLQRDRDRTAGTAFQFGLFVDQTLVGEINLNNIVRGALQSGTIGYWIDRRHAGHAYTAEGVVLLFEFAFDQIGLHRVEICIVPRNHRSHAVMHKIGVRAEGTAERYLEINGVWEDHVRYGFTAEEWEERRDELVARWLGRGSVVQ